MIASSFEIALETIRKKNLIMAEGIMELLEAWRKESSAGIRIVDNLKADTKITVDLVIEILEILFLNRHLPITDLENKIYKDKCYSNTLRGAMIDKGKISRNVGGAKPVDDFVAGLRDRIKTMKVSRAIQLVHKMCSSTETLTLGEKNITLSQYSCWCTWSETNDHNPFDFVTDPNMVLKVVANLGLSHRQKFKEHLLFIYPKTAVEEIRYPTIADAALYSYFKCSSSMDYCGRTQPWYPDDYEDRSLSSSDVKPRPEGVHKPIKLGDLVKPVQKISNA
jgi:hypothetical protein